MRLPLILLLTTLLHLAFADELKDNQICVSGCQLAVDGLTFIGSENQTDYYVIECTNILRAKSLYVCSRKYCQSGDIAPGIEYFNWVCETYGFVSLPPYDIIANYTDADIDSLPQVALADALSPDPISDVVLPSPELFDMAFQTINTWSFEINTHLLYGWVMYWFWTIVVAIGLGTRLLSYLHSVGEAKSIPDNEANSPPFRVTRRVAVEKVRLIARQLMLPTTFGSWGPKLAVWQTVPPIVQTLTVVAFIIINVVCCSVNYRLFIGNMYWSDTRLQLWRYISDRTGIISIANVPILWLFASRNNFLLWITGWDFSIFNNFHRWVALLSTIEAIVHSVGYTVDTFLAYGADEFYLSWQEEYWYSGAIATIAMSLILLFSLQWLRHRFYEIFLYTHLGLSVIFLVTLWYHIKIFEGEYDGYIWPCVALWSFDRLIRIVRVLMVNPMFWKMKAFATYDQDSNMIRLEYNQSASVLKPFPGSYYYIYVFNGMRIWENHPFTLAACTTSCPESDGEHSSGDEKKHESTKPGDVISQVIGVSSRNDSLSSDSQGTSHPKLTFLMRPYDGFTNRPRKSIISSTHDTASQASTLRVLVEGPYGHALPLHRYHNILFLIGGSGITVATSYLANMFSSLHPRSTSEPKSKTVNVNIIWAVPQRAFLDAVLNKELSHISTLGNVTVDGYITGTSVSPTKTPSPSPTDASNGLTTIHTGRPDVIAIIAAAFSDRGLFAVGTSAIVACGPPEMAREARWALVRAIDNHKEVSHVEFYEEKFGW